MLARVKLLGIDINKALPNDRFTHSLLFHVQTFSLPVVVPVVEICSGRMWL